MASEADILAAIEQLQGKQPSERLGPQGPPGGFGPSLTDRYDFPRQGAQPLAPAQPPPQAVQQFAQDVAAGVPAGQPESGVPEAYDTPSQNQVGRDVAAGMTGVGATNAAMMGELVGGFAPSGPAQAPLPKRLDWDKAGGRENIAQLTEEYPTRQAAAVEAKGVNESEAQKRLESLYKSHGDELAQYGALKERERQQSMDMYAMRVQEMDQKAKQIAAHQYDEGTFFRSPGGLLATIGAMFAVGASNDKTIGVKLINSYIDRESRQFQQDHENLQADLYGLKTNLGEYRQMMGSKEAGDLMQRAQMKEVAAAKINEISAQLQSQEALTTANFTSAQLMKSAAADKMNATMRAFQDPKLVDPRLASQFMGGDVDVLGPQGAKAPAAPGVPQAAVPGAQGTSAAAAKPGGGVVSVPGKPGERTATTVVDAPDVIRKKQDKIAWGKRVSERTGIPANELVQFRDSIVRNLDAQVSLKAGDPRKPGYEAERRKAVAEVFGTVTPAQIAVVGARVQPLIQKSSAVRGFSEHMEWIKNDPSFKLNDGSTDYHAIDQVLGTGLNRVMGMSPYDRKKYLNDRALMSSPGDRSLADSRAHAAMVYISKMQMAKNAYGHAISGGAITPLEEQRLNKVLDSNDNFQTVQSSIGSMSKAFGDELKSALITSGSPLASLNILEGYGTAQPELATQGKPGKKE